VALVLSWVLLDALSASVSPHTHTLPCRKGHLHLLLIWHRNSGIGLEPHPSALISSTLASLPEGP
jgi:hypothetical protein